MDKPVLIIEMPELSDEAVIGIHQFLAEMREAFESHYFYQIQPYYRQPSQQNEIEKPF